MLAAGSRALPQVGETDGRFGLTLYLHYRILKGRKDAKDLVDIARSGFFHPSYYMRHSPDVFSAGDDPLLHFVDRGAAELRDPSPLFHTKSYLDRHPQVVASGINPLLHFVLKAGALSLRVAELFFSLTDAPVELGDLLRLER
jgi:hypothetical protein